MHVSQIKGSRLNPFSKTGDFKLGYDLSDFRKAYPAANKMVKWDMEKESQRLLP